MCAVGVGPGDRLARNETRGTNRGNERKCVSHPACKCVSHPACGCLRDEDLTLEGRDPQGTDPHRGRPHRGRPTHRGSDPHKDKGRDPHMRQGATHTRTKGATHTGDTQTPNNHTKRQSRFIKDCTVLAMNLGTEHTTYKRAGARNVLNRMCKSFKEMWPKSGLRNVGGHPPGYRGGY